MIKQDALIGVNLRKFRIPIVIIVILLVCSMLLVLELKNEAMSLPPQYLGSCNLDSGRILLNGVDPGEGIGTLVKGKSTLMQAASLYGNDIYVAIGDRLQAVVLAHPKDTANGEIDTTITLPVSHRSGAASLHIYSTLKTGECSDRWAEVYIP